MTAKALIDDRTGMKITFDELHKYCVKHADFFQKHMGEEVVEKDFWEGIQDFLGYKTKMGRWAAVMYGVYIDKDHITVGLEIPGRPELGWDGDYTGFILEALDDIPQFIGILCREQEGYFNWDEDISVCKLLDMNGDEATDMTPFFGMVYGVLSWYLRKEKGWKTYAERRGDDWAWNKIAEETWSEKPR